MLMNRLVYRMGLLLSSILVFSPVIAQEPSISADLRPLVPHRVFSLIHAPEVHKELGLNDAEVGQLEEQFQKWDGDWFRSRNLPTEKSFAELDRLEKEFWAWAKGAWSVEQLKRLKQIEAQSQGNRMFVRKEIAKAVKLTSVQVKKFTDLASATEVAQKKLEELAMKGGDTSAATEAVAEATSAEQKAIASILTPEQTKELKALVGSIFDTKQLKRIYPMAPEFAPDTEWFNSSPLTLESLKGKVVVIHFYAFQCHNCHANFEIYRRWHEKYADQGVVMIGIQSPETPDERDPAAVREAAKDRKLEFPIVMDREMKNWDRWANTMWPTVYVIDKRGYLRHWWQGELNWQGATADKTIEAVIEAALAE
ncbi:MAG: redoxin domain-containing protein [Pirellula sp.]|jgi:peroxiredoxin